MNPRILQDEETVGLECRSPVQDPWSDVSVAKLIDLRSSSPNDDLDAIDLELERGVAAMGGDRLQKKRHEEKGEAGSDVSHR